MNAGPSRRWVYLLYLNTVLLQAVTFVARPTAIYRAIELDVPAAWLGALGASFAVVPLILAVPMGHVADRFGEQRVIVLGCIFTTAACLLFAVGSTSVWGLLLASVVLGTGHLGANVGQQALVANRTTPDRLDTAFGHYTFAAATGQALGPGLIVFFGGGAAIPDTHAIFGWTTGLSGLLLMSALAMPGRPTTARRENEASGSVQDLLRRRGLVRALTVSCVVLAAVDISLVYLPALGTERGISAGFVGALLTVRAISSMVSRFFLGWLTARAGRANVMSGSIAVAALSMALVPVPMPAAMLVVVVAAMGLGLGAGQPLTMAWLAEATPPGLRGRAMSLRLTGNRLGQVLVPSAAGAVAAGAGAGGVLWLTAGLLVLVSASSRRIPQ